MDSENVEAELRSLIVKRGQLKASVTRFSTFLKRFDENKRITELQSRLMAIEAIWGEFDKIQSRIESLTDPESVSDERESFEDHYFDTISIAKEMLLDYEKNQSQYAIDMNALHDLSNANKNNSHFYNVAKLPTVDLPKFYGDLHKWLNFRDKFITLVHSDKTMSNITKFHYLSSCLRGEAEEAISSLEVTNENYETAWARLRDRYEDKKVIKRSHLKTLIEWPQITQESHVHLRKLIDGLLSHLKSLKSLGEPTDSWDTLMIHIFSSKLDHNSKCKWEDFSADIDEPKITDFITCLSKRCRYLQSLYGETSTSKPQTKYSYKKSSENKSLSHVVTSNISCHLCKDAHYVYRCPALLKMSPKLRLEEVKGLKLCTNCLRSTHMSDNCTSGACKHCGRKHNTLLHFDERVSTNTTARDQHSNKGENKIQSSAISANISTYEGNSDFLPEDDNTVSINTHCLRKETSDVLLSTALVNISDKFGRFHTCRVLLDSGSQSNFIRKDLCDLLQLNKQRINIPIAGINQISTNISYRTNATIQSKFNAYSVDLTFLVLGKITENLPVSKINPNQLQIPNNIILADPNYHVPSKIDLLIGASVFFELLSIGQIKLGDSMPVLQKTRLGWIISGSIPRIAPVESKNSTIVCNFSSILHPETDSLDKQIEKFWNVENIADSPKLSKEENECEEHFLSTTVRDKNGHFIVDLPLRENIHDIGNSYENALKRFYLLEKKLSRNKILRLQYTNFIKEYEGLGHMSLIDTSNDQNKISYYLPHHGVLKETSITTKLRVVFDASAKGDSGISLNDKLKVGATVQESLFSILLRFRKHKFVIVADIEKMYRQVFVQEKQRDLQRILWRLDPGQPIKHYRLNTVTYGTASASFLATRSLQQVGIECKSLYPGASKAILNDFYVDDLLTGAESVDDAKDLIRDLMTILNSYGFPLRKWISNNTNIIEELIMHNSLGHNVSHFLCDDKITKTLGLLWNAEADTFQYVVNDDSNLENFDTVTKRKILSTISQIFDPLGLIGPVVIRAKILLQRLWQLKTHWDEALPADLYTTWVQFRKQIQSLRNLKVPRYIVCCHPVVIQLHSFSDASEKSYGTCIYLRSTDLSNNHSIRLVCGKSRVAPLKNISLPRLELCGALLSAQLTRSVIDHIDMKIDKVFHWCDSTITLAWIAAEPNNWKTFVANRVSEIQRLTDKTQWKHVSSKENPADIISRGVDPDQLSKLDLWWYGPHWLAYDQELWPSHNSHSFDVGTDAPEKRQPIVVLATQINDIDQDIFLRFSSFSKLQRVTALCLRFIKNLHSNTIIRTTGFLSSSELNEALTSLIKLAQFNEFSSEIQSLNRSKQVAHNSKLASLNPFIDQDGLIRVGGRLKNSNMPYNYKHPIVLPSHHQFTKLLISHEHIRHLHAGAQATLCAIRVKYWPLNGRNSVRGVLRRCVTCFKAKPRDTHHKMGQLPESRLKPCRPFSVIGIDFAGPFYIKDGKYRNRKIVKCYLCVFICFVTRAIHLELVGDLSTDSFLNSLKRMVSRRGLCKTIYSDNGTNFVGANNELRELHSLLSNLDKNSKFRDFVTQNNISWNFIPPRSPHFGGIWEAAVKSAKYHLTRILGNANLTYEAFYTVLTQVEAVLNSRPLTPLSSDPNDFHCLTPSHFLIGEPLTAIPQEDVSEVPINRLSHYKQLQQLVQHFWSRWSREYINSFHQMTKWKFQQPNQVHIGSMVLLKDENLPPLQWKLGRICEVFPGPDSVVRVVNVKTSSGTVRRAITKICILPTET